MKTNLVAALLMGAATLGLLTGCGDDDKPKETAVKIYKSIDECKVDHSNEDCQKAFDGAQEVHVTSSPRIPTREECIAKYGVDACIARRDAATGNEWFAPAMAGFMIGHMVGNLSTPTYQPIYIDRGGSAYSGTTHLGSYRSSCSQGGYGCSTGGFVSVPGGTGTTWTRSYSTTTISTTGTGKNSYVVVPSTRGGLGGSASTAASGYTASVGKSSVTGSSSIASPGVSSARGGFGMSAAGASAGG